jgi:hypothetical protein
MDTPSLPPPSSAPYDPSDSGSHTPVSLLVAGGRSVSTACKRAKSVRTFSAGARVDAMDLEGVWHEGVVKEVDGVQVGGREGELRNNPLTEV